MKDSKDLNIKLWVLYFSVFIFIWMGATTYFWLTGADMSATHPDYYITQRGSWIAPLYVFLGFCCVAFVILDKLVKPKKGVADIPIDVITFDNLNLKRDIPLGLMLLTGISFLSYTMDMAFIGMPGAVAGAMALGETSKAILTSSVAPIENILISSILPATLYAWLFYRFKPKKLLAKFLIALPCAILGGITGVVWHSFVYPSHMAFARLSTFIFFSIGSFVTLATRCILALGILHIGYNFLNTFLLHLPYAISLIT